MMAFYSSYQAYCAGGLLFQRLIHALLSHSEKHYP